MVWEALVGSSLGYHLSCLLQGAIPFEATIRGGVDEFQLLLLESRAQVALLRNLAERT